MDTTTRDEMEALGLRKPDWEKRDIAVWRFSEHLFAMRIGDVCCWDLYEDELQSLCDDLTYESCDPKYVRPPGHRATTKECYNDPHDCRPGRTIWAGFGFDGDWWDILHGGCEFAVSHEEGAEIVQKFHEARATSYRDAQLKRQLLDLAASGAERPAPDTELGQALEQFTTPPDEDLSEQPYQRMVELAEAERSSVDAKIRRMASKQGYTANKRRTTGLWYFTDSQNWLASPEQGFSEDEALEWLLADGGES